MKKNGQKPLKYSAKHSEASVHVRVASDLFGKIVEYARKNYMTVSQAVRALIVAGFKEE